MVEKKNRFPARLHVLLARESPMALIIRRGPAKAVCTIRWDRSRDTFRIGQWLNGRIYERRCDLSPDGKHFIYFAMNGRWASPTGGSWTAISRTPYLKAVGLWGKSDCWNGGGLFTSNTTFWLNGSTPYPNGGHKLLEKPRDKLFEDKKFSWHTNYGGECPGVYYIRLQRDDWKMARSRTFEGPNRITIFEKPVKGGWILRKRAFEGHGSGKEDQGRGVYHDEHELEHIEDGHLFEVPGAEWADMDGKRLVWVSEGCLYSGSVGVKGVKNVELLRDFNTMEFQRITAPY
ncbi:MAG TPA: hypothetical protein VGG10_20145 [Rhizomicrobium sp.]|jgi:hypothetical protein